MPTIHISRTDAASNFDELIAQARTGSEFWIDDDASTLAVLSAPSLHQSPRLISDILAGLSKTAGQSLEDQSFSDDVTEGLRAHESESVIDPWESF